MTALIVLEALVIGVLAVLVIGLLRSHAEILRRLHELGAGVYDDSDPTIGAAAGHDHDHGGITSPIELSASPSFGTRPGVAAPGRNQTPAHDLAGIAPTGAAKALGVIGVGHSTLLAFLSSGCGTCMGFWTAFGDGQADHLPGTDTRLVIVTRGRDRESQAAVAELAPAQHPTLMSSEAFDDYGVEINPYFILVDGPTGAVVGEGAAATWAQVSDLLRQAAADNGLATESNRQGRQVSHLNGIERERRADEELASAGIGPGHSSLYPDHIETPLTGEPEDALESGAGSGH